ncbi:MAG: hypothetical protein ACI9S8_002283, partial [Chlamydiales bacterium]
MTNSIEGLGGGGTGAVTGAELDLLEEGKVKLAGAESKLNDALDQVDEAKLRMDAFEDMVLFNYGAVTGLRTELNRARGELKRIQEEKVIISELVRRISIQVTLAERELGKGTDALRVFLDKIGDLEGDQPATELMESLESGRLSLDVKVQELEDHLNGVSGDLGFGDLVEHSKTEMANIGGRSVEVFLELELPNLLSVSEGSFLQRKLRVDTEVRNIDSEEAYLISISKALNKGGISVDSNNAFNKALEEMVKLPSRGSGQRAEGLVAKAARGTEWGNLGASGTAMGYVNEATQQLEASLVNVENAQNLFNIENGRGVSEFKAGLNNFWASNVAIGLFKLRNEEDVTLPTAFQVENQEYVVRPAEGDQDFISQGGYVEMVNLLHTMEDAIANSGKGTLFTRSEENAFWGITEEKIFQVISPDGASIDVKQTVRLDAPDRAAKREGNISDWEGTTALQDYDVNIDSMADHDFFLLACRIMNASKQLKNISTGGALSPGLAAQARWTASLTSILGAAHDELKLLDQTGRNRPITLATGVETTSGMLGLRKAFKTWTSVGGLDHYQHMKSALKQINVGEGTSGTIIRPSTQDLLFFEYASTGEAALNRQIGSLGETMELLNNYLEQLNNVDGVMSDPELQVNHKGLLENSSSFQASSDGVAIVNALNGLFEMVKVKSDVIGTKVTDDGKEYKTDAGETGQLNSAQRIEVAKLLARAKLRLKGDNGFDSATDEIKRPLEEIEQGEDDTGTSKESEEHFTERLKEKRNDVEKSFKSFVGEGQFVGTPATLSGYELDEINSQMQHLNQTLGDLPEDTTFFSHIGLVGTTAATAELIQDSMHHLFNDEGFSGNLSAAITHGQGVNDVLKQNLKKTMFVYQEF